MGCLEPGDVSGPSALLCRDRWLALQRAREAAGVDAALLVLGPDAQFSRGGEVAFNWLLGGLGGRDLLAAPLEAKYEECIVCLRASRSVVFCKRAVQDEVIARTSMWESCEVIVPTTKEEADQDSYDARKTSAFLDMVAPCTSIGVALRMVDEHADLKMSIERWPLVQAYAYDEYGLGFLTMNKSVVNLELALQMQSYSGWDLQTVARAQELVPQLRKAWEEALLVQDKCSPAGQGSPHGTTAAAPLADHFEYGRLALTDEDILEFRGLAPPAEGVPTLLDPAPRVLAGPTLSAQVLLPGDWEAPAQQPPAGEVPLHVVWEAVDPLMGIAATRTYALSTAFTGAAAGGPKLNTLLRAYAAAVALCCHLTSSVLGAVAFAPDRDDQLRRAAAAFLGESVAGTPHIACVAMDTMGMPLEGAPPASGVAQLFLRIAIKDIREPSTGEVLGTVAYGDTALCARASPSAPPAGATCCTLTGGLPAFAFWPSADTLEHSGRLKADMDLALGIGQDPGPFVALGHRSGMKVHLSPPGPPPDPLGLGSVIDTGVKGVLALDVSPAMPGAQPVVGQAHGVVWTFSSGKAVLSSPRTGYLLLQVCGGAAVEEAADGLVWVLVTCPEWSAGDGALPLLALAVSPATAAQWRLLPQVEAAAPTEDLQWVESPGAGAQGAAAFMEGVALTEAHLGLMPPELCGAVFLDQATGASSAPCRCIWVSGLPGCGALDVATGLAKALGAPVMDLAAVPGLGLQARMDDAASIAAALAQELVARLPGQAVVVVCDVRCAPASVLTDLAGQSALAGVCEISHVVSVLEPSVAHPWGSIRHPLLLSRAHRGWVDAVVVQGGPSDSRLVRELRACRGARSPVLHNPTVGSLLERDGPLWQAAANAPLRALALPGFPGAGPEAATWRLGQPHMRLQCAFVPLSRPLDVGAFRSCCTQLLAAAASAAGGWAPPTPWKGLFCIEARFPGADAAELYQSCAPEQLLDTLRGGAATAQHTLVQTARSEVKKHIQHWAAPLDGSLGALLWWCLPAGAEVAPDELSRQAETAIRACYLRPPEPLPQWMTEDVPLEEVERLEVELREAGMPAGYFFNGVQYVDVDGAESQWHPDLPARLDAHLAEHNAGVEAWNAIAREAAALPIFA